MAAVKIGLEGEHEEACNRNKNNIHAREHGDINTELGDQKMLIRYDLFQIHIRTYIGMEEYID